MLVLLLYALVTLLAMTPSRWRDCGDVRWCARGSVPGRHQRDVISRGPAEGLAVEGPDFRGGGRTSGPAGRCVLALDTLEDIAETIAP